MDLNKLRYSLTDHTEKFFFTYENYRLLIHPSIIQCRDLLNRLDDDIEIIPDIEKTIDNTDIKFYQSDYNEEIYSKRNF